MVTSYMMIEKEMGYRGSKSEITELAAVKTISVKEQRVDGSCFGSGRYPKLRCTLMGFERYYQISIPSNQIIIQTFTSGCTACCCTLYSDFSTFAFALCSYFYSINSCLCSDFYYKNKNKNEASSRVTGRGQIKNKTRRHRQQLIIITRL
jgi:hypothetical protein